MPVATIDQVFARVAVERIVSRTTFDCVITGSTNQGVIIGSTLNQLWSRARLNEVSTNLASQNCRAKFCFVGLDSIVTVTGLNHDINVRKRSCD